VDNLFSPKHSLKFLSKFEHFPLKYKTKCELVFFSEHSVYYKYSNFVPKLRLPYGLRPVAVNKDVIISADGTVNENLERVLFCCTETEIKTLLALSERSLHIFSIIYIKL